MKVEIRGLDVWGNEKDGFEVNDVLGVQYSFECDILISNETILKFIHGLALVGKINQYSLDDWSDDSHIYGNVVHRKSGKPIVQYRSND